jgi:hypothetical protein
MYPTGPSYTWWKIILGSFLIFINVKLLLFPQARALQADNFAQSVGMFAVTAAMILLGGWLLISGVRAGRPKPPLQK